MADGPTPGVVQQAHRGLLAEGTRATVHSVEVEGDAVILGLGVSRTAHMARAAPPQRPSQACSVDGEQIIESRGSPDRDSVHARPAPAWLPPGQLR
jgi:hypothetical protein